jgi:nuclear pore complex protein Nup133
MEIRIRVPSILLLASRLLYLLELVSYGSMPRYHTITALPLASSDEPLSQALKGIPTCYIFACPMENVCPYHALVPYGPSREPGLILLSVKGEIKFWDSIGIGLAGGEHYSSTFLDLVGSEYISNFIRADVSRLHPSEVLKLIRSSMSFSQPQTYIATTSSGRLFRLTLTSSGGKNHLTPHLFSRPLPSLTLANFLPSLFSSPPTFQPDSGNISAVALGEKALAGGKEVWALVDTRVQKWNMSVEGWEEVVLDMEVAGLLRRGIRDVFEGVPGDDSELDLELVDIAVERCVFNLPFCFFPPCGAGR